MSECQPLPVLPQGLDTAKKYVIHELNPAPGRAPVPCEGKTLGGAELMHDGLLPSCTHAIEACVIELSPQAEKN